MSTNATKYVNHWRENELAQSKNRMATLKPEFYTLSGIPIDDIYVPNEITPDYEKNIGLPGRFPFTRGIHATMHRARHWTIRQVAGFGTAEDTNGRYKYLLAHGETGLSTDFDLPTLLGRDSDHVMARPEIGRIGVAIDSLTDANILFDGIPLDKISTSLTINPTAHILIAMYQSVGEGQGVPAERLTGTAQTDILKEYIAQNEYIYPPKQSVKLVVDMLEYTSKVMPKFNPISVSGYHIRDAGANAIQELAFTFANAICYLEEVRRRGIDVDSVAPRISFFFNVQNDFLEEIAKLRAARRMWARITRDRFGCKNERSWLMRTHCQTSGVSLTAQQPFNNIARTAIQALAAVLGGTQSLHTNSMDEAFSIPSEEAIKVAVRTQQIIAHESGVADVVDPLAGSYYIEHLTDELETRAMDLIKQIDDMGGMLAAIESGFVQKQIAHSALKFQREVEAGERYIIGVNAFAEENEPPLPFELCIVDEEAQERQIARLAEVRRTRDNRAVKQMLAAVGEAARAERNIMPSVYEAVKVQATVGEISDVLREVYGTYTAPAVF